MPVLPHTETRTVVNVLQGKSGRRTWNRAIFAVMILATSSLGAQCGAGAECVSCLNETKVRVLAYVEPPSTWILILNGVEVAHEDVSPNLADVPPWILRGTLRDTVATTVDVELRDAYATMLFLAQISPDFDTVEDECDSTRTCEHGIATIEIHEFLPPPGDDSSDDDSAEE